MGIFFTNGETKIRAGVYQRYVNVGTPEIAGAQDGVVAIVLKSNWGEIGKVKEFYSYDELLDEYGEGGTDGTVAVAKQVFNGGAKQVYAVRLGTEGTKGSITLKDSATTAVDAITVTAKHYGDRAFTYQIRTALGESNVKEFVVRENGLIIEKIQFAAPGFGEVFNLVEAGQASKYFDFALKSGYSGQANDSATAVKTVAETEFTPGTNASIVNGDYSAAFTLLEAYDWNCICLDTVDRTVQQLVYNYVERIYEGGKMCFCVIGEPVSTVKYDDRVDHAKAYNDYNVVYVGGGFKDTLDNFIEGEYAAAYVAGKVAAIPSSQSLTHEVISGASDVIEMLTNSQHERAIKNGMLTFSVSPDGAVWIESGITTLTTPSGNDDEGWKKIKRTKVRFELMTRVSNTVAPLIGRINNNSDGRATVLQAVRGVLSTMIAEEKLLPGATVEIDPSRPPVADSAWFIIQADDVDALEKTYFVYQFRYAAA